MNPFFLDSKERLLAWRELRNQITNEHDDIAKIMKMLKWWAQAPICRFSIDAYEYKLWPTAWELLNENNFCDTAMAVMMIHTLAFSGFDTNRMKLSLIDTTSDMRMVVIIDKDKVLNYSYAEITRISELPKETKVIITYEYDKENNSLLPV